MYVFGGSVSRGGRGYETAGGTEACAANGYFDFRRIVWKFPGSESGRLEDPNRKVERSSLRPVWAAPQGACSAQGPEGRRDFPHGCAVAYHNARLFVFGGLLGAGGSAESRGRLFSYHFVSERWTAYGDGTRDGTRYGAGRETDVELAGKESCGQDESCGNGPWSADSGSGAELPSADLHHPGLRQKHSLAVVTVNGQPYLLLVGGFNGYHWLGDVFLLNLDQLTSGTGLARAIGVLFKLPQFADVVIATRSRSILAHKCILLARCPYLFHLLSEEPECTSIDLTEWPASCVEAVLGWMYSGELIAEHVDETVALMDFLCITSLE
ncbi:BTB/POZ domain protein [Gregarina niphandrodes]|uniref:BTB/POZ domain protein n=1 Tax=Gregarina niphandrodes TaxID=110365 RepID=A0A023B1A0_GRENI|nr:BTB/POZ domain protein [Gregarina niphandrodes]EZG46244.1 BTB/POZ domain protein [Gregarina niphandrodes]|eukprot:XP_011132314.1 BTB/POZ domain protein [Gregarina niphandrodes]